MKRIVLLICFLSLVSMLLAQDEIPVIDLKNAVGTWQGYYDQGGFKKNIKIEFKEETGKLECFIDLPDQGIMNARFKISICSSNEFHMERTGLDKTAWTFVGKPDGNKMSGRYKTGDSCGIGKPLTFEVVKSTGVMPWRKGWQGIDFCMLYNSIREEKKIY